MPPSPASISTIETQPDIASQWPDADNATKQSEFNDDECLNAPGSDKVMVVLKTGATEIYEKLPIHLVTLFRCTPHYLIFSDLAQTFSDYPIHDALGTVSSHLKANHDDFNIYRDLQKYQQEGQNPSKLKGGKGWNLDKWKFLPMLHESYRMASPEVDWFVYIEADTSLSWPNLLIWLQTLDPKKPLYLGAQNVIGETTFGHGGSGVILSRATQSRLAELRQEEGPELYDQRWESMTSSSCCGDEIIARAFLEVDVELTPSWPRIQGETVSTLDWTDRHWCSPAVTWHHVSPTQVDAMWQYQANWVNQNGWAKPYLYKDIFDEFVSRHVSVNRTSWNNLSQDTKYARPSDGDDDSAAAVEFGRLPLPYQQSVESFEDCEAACRDNEACIQYMWEPGRCHLGKDIRLGNGDDREEHHWMSGWLLDRIQDKREDLEPCKIKWHV
ncbi:hypothetical protein BDV97DRAFT_394482 [Delphinella strobiligena]|nr:hypothetical protein BDV97DRAFT_394482 [Delphinella strobiligena]